MRKRRLRTMAAALTGILVLAGAAAAGDFGRHGHGGLPSATRWGDSFAGAISAASFRHGTYFYMDRSARPHSPPPETKRPARRVVIDARTAQCAYEAGVCVIRP